MLTFIATVFGFFLLIGGALNVLCNLRNSEGDRNYLWWSHSFIIMYGMRNKREKSIFEFSLFNNMKYLKNIKNIF